MLEKGEKMKRKLAIALIMLTMFTTTIDSYAAKVGCTSTKRRVCVTVGKDKDGKDIVQCEDIYDTKCVDKIVGVMYFTKDINGNVYDMDGKLVGKNGEISVGLDVNAITKSMKTYDNQGIEYDKRKLDNIYLKTQEDAIPNTREYNNAYGWKTDKSLQYKDFMKNFANKGLQNISVVNSKIDKQTGRVQATVKGSFPKEGLDLEQYKNNQAALKNYLGHMPDSLQKQLDYMSKEGTVQRELVMVPYAVEVHTSYSRKVEVIPPPPAQDPKPKGGIIIDDVIGCPSYLTWTEIDHDKVVKSETYFTDSKGKEYKYNKVTWKPHKYRYRIDFTTDVTITDAKGRNLKTNSIKSGYGFKVETKTTHKVSGGDGRPHTLELNIKTPQLAYEQHDWNMTHIYKNQPKVNYLKSTGQWSYDTPVNPLSKTKSNVIYTDRELEDGKHKIFIEVKNISVAGRYLCTKNFEELTIKGNMYEDYTVN